MNLGVNSHHEALNAEHLGDVQDSSFESLDDEFGMEDTDDVDDTEESSKIRKKANERKGDTTKKRRSKQPTSIALFKGEITDRELLSDQSEKAAKTKLKQQREGVYKKIQAEYKESSKELFGEKSENRLKDVISISSSFEKERLNKLSKANESRETIKSSLFSDKNSDLPLNPKNAEELQKIKLEKNQIQQQKISKDSSIKETLQTYVGAFSEAIIDEKPLKKQEVKQLRELLQQKGVSTKKLSVVERNVQKYIRKDLKKKLKQGFLETAMFYATDRTSRDTIGKFYNYKELFDMGKSLGVLDEGISDEKTYKDELKFETRAFIANELDASLAEARLKTDDVSELIKSFDKFNKLSGFSSFNAGEYMKELNRKLFDQGLTPFINPNAAKQASLDTESQGRRQKDQSSDDEDGESLEDSLRILYVKEKTSSSSPIGFLKMKAKIMSYEKKLRALGQGGSIDKLKKESSNVAVFKLSIRLRQTFEERATLPELKGSRYKVNKSALKDTLKGLKGLGRNVSKSDMIEVRDQANRSIFTLIKEEYIKLEVFAQSSKNNITMSMKLKEYKQILERLKSESKIQESVKPKLMQDLSFLSDLNVVEAA